MAPVPARRAGERRADALLAHHENFVPSVLRCTAVDGPGACYNVHLPLARLRAAGAGKDALVEAVTAEVASLVNDATVTFVDSGEEDAVAGPAG